MLEGAVVCVRWSLDGASLLTLGEDGAGKVWSRSGMLRSTMAQHPSPAYAGAWAPDSSAILVAVGNTLTIKPVQVTTTFLCPDIAILIKVSGQFEGDTVGGPRRRHFECGLERGQRMDRLGRGGPQVQGTLSDSTSDK